MSATIDPLLGEKLTQLGVSRVNEAPDPKTWATFLSWVNDQYRHLAEDRQRLREIWEGQVSELENKLAAAAEARQEIVEMTNAALCLIQDAVTSCLGGTGQRSRLALQYTLLSFLAEELPDRDEEGFAPLRSRLVELADQVTELIEQANEGADALRGLRDAGAIQKAWMDRARDVCREQLTIASYYSHAERCGGDWLSAYDAGNGNVLVVMADVTGHGVGSALMTGVVQGAADVLVRTTPPGALRPAAFLQALDASLCSAGGGEMLATCAAATIDGSSGAVRLASAGHPLPLLLRGGRQPTIDEVVTKGPVLGHCAETRYEEIEFALTKGDTLLWYTDGLSERQDERQRPFGKRRLASVLLEVANQKPDAIRARLRLELEQFAGQVPAHDDYAFVIAQFGA